MAYITQTTLEDRFGVKNIARWSNKDGGTTADTDNITAAINYAENTVESLLRDRYEIPLTNRSGSSTLPALVIEWMASLAAVKLYMERGIGDAGDDDSERNHMAVIESDVRKDIGRCRSRVMNVDLTEKDSTGPNAPVIV